MRFSARLKQDRFYVDASMSHTIPPYLCEWCDKPPPLYKKRVRIVRLGGYEDAARLDAQKRIK